MRFLVCLLFTPLFLLPLGIKDLHIASDSEKIEIIFLLDSTFNSSVSREDSDTLGVVVFKNISLNQKKIIEHTKLIKRIEIFQKDSDLYVVFAENDFGLKYSVEVLNSNRILKIIVTKNESISSSLMANTTAKDMSLESAIDAIKNNSNENNNYITTKSPLELETWRYVAVIMVLSTLLIALIIIKRKMRIKDNGKEFSYFKTHKSSEKDNSLVKVSNFDSGGVGVSKIINIDLKNKIVVLDGKDYKYLLFVGEHNSFIIDRIQSSEFDDDDISFSELLERKEARLPFVIKDYKNEKY